MPSKTFPRRSTGTTRATTASAKPTLFNETLAVEAVSNKFGNGSILVGNEWISLNDGASLDDIENGSSYVFEIKMGNNGKRYINRVVERVETEETAEKEVEAPAPARRSSPVAAAPVAGKKGEFRSPEEIMRSSAIGIAAQSELYKKMLEEAGNVDDAKGMLADCADFMLRYIQTGSAF